jgi:hypothetical protein
MERKVTNTAASVRQRLLNRARAEDRGAAPCARVVQRGEGMHHQRGPRRDGRGHRSPSVSLHLSAFRLRFRPLRCVYSRGRFY